MASKRFEDRILNDLLPAFCNHPARRYGTAGFKPNFHNVDDLDAENFLKGLDAGLVTLVGRRYQAPRSRTGEVFFWEHEKAISPRPITIWIEPIITIATLARLHFELGWPKELLGTQSVDDAFDVTAFLGSDTRNEHIACEVKKTISEADRLLERMRGFAMLPPDDAIRGPGRNAYRKVKGLRARRAPIFWIIGPGGYNHAFEVEYLDDGLIEFEAASIRDLRYPASSIALPRSPD